MAEWLEYIKKKKQTNTQKNMGTWAIKLVLPASVMLSKCKSHNCDKNIMFLPCVELVCTITSVCLKLNLL